MRSYAQPASHIKQLKGNYSAPIYPCCVSRSGVSRYRHDWDKDGVCIYCDKQNMMNEENYQFSRGNG